MARGTYERQTMVRRSATGRIGIADVAVKAGVSHATVSRVMNGNFTVDPEIAAREQRPGRRLYTLTALGEAAASAVDTTARETRTRRTRRRVAPA